MVVFRHAHSVHVDLLLGRRPESQQGNVADLMSRTVVKTRLRSQIQHVQVFQPYRCLLTIVYSSVIIPALQLNRRERDDARHLSIAHTLPTTS